MADYKAGVMADDNVTKTKRRRQMWGFKAILIGVLGVLIIGGLAQVSTAQAEPNTEMYSVSGTIEWINVKLGKLKLKSDAGQDTRGITEYRINLDATRVTDPTDKKFLVIKDLRAGQHVTVQLKNSYGETMIQKIIAEPMQEPVLSETTSTTTTTTTKTTVKH